MTVSKGAAGKAMAMFISSICSRSTMKTKIWWCEYRNSMDTLRVKMTMMTKAAR